MNFAFNTIMITIKKTGSISRNHFEIIAWQAGISVGGIDEVGRGAWCGPVVAATVILPISTQEKFLRDSKEMTPQERDEAYLWIIEHAAYGIGFAHHRCVADVNVYQATLKAMRRSLLQLQVLPEHSVPKQILVDAMPLTISEFEGEIYHFIYGERRSASIAAASIVAKVTRDRLMVRLDSSFPQYGFAHHKGYGTPVHQKNLKSCGLSLLHRPNYCDSVINEHVFQESFL